MATPKLTNESSNDDEEPEPTDSQVADEDVADAVADENAEQDEGAEEEQEEVPTEDVDMPEDDEEANPAESGGSLLGGTTFGMSNKVLLGLGVGAVIGVVVLIRLTPESGPTDYQNEKEVREATTEGGDGAADRPERGARQSSNAYVEEQQDQAIGQVFK